MLTPDCSVLQIEVMNRERQPLEAEKAELMRCV